MRSKLAKAVRKEFAARLKRSLPQFKLAKLREIEFLGKMEKEIPPGYRLYLWDFSKDLCVYLVLCIATPKMGDAFTVECAWTRNGRFPSLLGLTIMHPCDFPKFGIVCDEPKDGDFLFRIGELWEPHVDHWWWVAPRPSFEEINKWSREGNFEGEKLFGPPEMPIDEAMKNVVPCVEDAINRIIEYAVPYFEKIITINKKT